MDDLIELASDWKALGTQLKIPPATLHAIEGERNRVANCLRAIIEEWLWYVAGPHTKAGLVEVLRKPSLGEKRLAKNIEKDNGIIIIIIMVSIFALIGLCISMYGNMCFILT